MAAGLPPDPGLDTTISPGQSAHIEDHQVIAGTLALLKSAAGMTPTEVVEDAGAQASLSGAFAAVNDPLGWGFPFTPGLLTQTTARSVSGANWAWYHRVVGGGTITKIGLQVVVQSGNICVAVYRSSGTGRSAVPGTRLATSGSVACPAAGYAEVSLNASVDVEAGDWFYLSADNTTATFRAASTSGSSALLGGFSRLQTASAFPAPSPAASSASAADNVFALVGVA